MTISQTLVRLYRHGVGPENRPLPSLLDELRITVTRQSRLSASFGSRSAEVPLVFHVAAASVYRNLSAFLLTQATHYRLTARRDVRPEFHAAFLYSRLDEIARSVDAPTFAAELYAHTDALLNVIDRPPDMWFAGPCPECRADLYAAEGAPTIACGVCEIVVDVAEQRERLLAAVDDVLATAAEISRAVHLTGQVVTPSKITNLYHRGKLVRHGRNRTGDHLYRVGDVLAVVTAQRAAV